MSRLLHTLCSCSFNPEIIKGYCLGLVQNFSKFFGTLIISKQIFCPNGTPVSNSVSISQSLTASDQFSNVNICEYSIGNDSNSSHGE